MSKAKAETITVEQIEGAKSALETARTEAQQCEQVAQKAIAADECAGTATGDACELAAKLAKRKLVDAKRAVTDCESNLSQLQAQFDEQQRAAAQAVLETVTGELFGSVREAVVEATQELAAVSARAGELAGKRDALLAQLGQRVFGSGLQLALSVESVLGRQPEKQLRRAAVALLAGHDESQLPPEVRQLLPDTAGLIAAAVEGRNVVAEALQAHSANAAAEKAAQDAKIQAVWAETLEGLPTTAPEGERSMHQKFRAWFRDLGPAGQIDVQRRLFFKFPNVEARRRFLQEQIQGSASVGTTSRADANWLARHVEPVRPGVN